MKPSESVPKGGWILTAFSFVYFELKGACQIHADAIISFRRVVCHPRIQTPSRDEETGKNRPET